MFKRKGEPKKEIKLTQNDRMTVTIADKVTSLHSKYENEEISFTYSSDSRVGETPEETAERVFAFAEKFLIYNKRKRLVKLSREAIEDRKIATEILTQGSQKQQNVEINSVTKQELAENAKIDILKGDGSTNGI